MTSTTRAWGRRRKARQEEGRESWPFSTHTANINIPPLVYRASPPSPACLVPTARGRAQNISGGIRPIMCGFLSCWRTNRNSGLAQQISTTNHGHRFVCWCKSPSHHSHLLHSTILSQQHKKRMGGRVWWCRYSWEKVEPKGIFSFLGLHPSRMRTR